MNKKIIISPYSQKLPSGRNNAKNYPYFKEVIATLKNKGYEIVQIGLDGEQCIDGADVFLKNQDFEQLKELIEDCFCFISVDNFFHHFCANYNKKGIVIFGKSDPRIFGHEIHANILKGRKYLREEQYNYWFDEEYVEDVFVKPEFIVQVFEKIFENKGD